MFRGQRGAVCQYFEQGGAAVTERGQAGPKLASRLGKEREGAYLEYMGRQVKESLIWRPTNPDEVEKLCRALVARKAAAWDGISPRVVKEVTCELAGSLSCLFNCCMRDGHYPA